MSFARRNGFGDGLPDSPILDSAPEWLRVDYWHVALEKIIEPTGDYMPTGRLDGWEVHKQLRIIQRNTDRTALGGSNLIDEIRSCDWKAFYDLVERVYMLLLIRGSEGMKVRVASARDAKEYADRVNVLFEESRVLWRLGTNGQLHRQLGADLGATLTAARAALIGHDAALACIDKATAFLTKRHLDPENAVKEAVSAAESFGRRIFSRANTFGDVLKELRRDPAFPVATIAIMEKQVCPYANNESGVRHGGPDPSSVTIEDADFFVHVTAAFIVRLASHTLI